MTYPHNTARRVIPLREIVRRSAKPRAKKPTPSFPAADQLVDDETRGRLRELGLPDIIIDRWSQSQADLHLQFDGGPFD